MQEIKVRKIQKSGQDKWEVDFGRDEEGRMQRPCPHSPAGAWKALEGLALPKARRL
jgi:hypothetical protein